MSECLLDTPLISRYATNRNDLIAEFYRPVMSQSVSYDRAVGYFRSSILLLAAEPVSDFAVRGGRIRIICSPELTPDDIDAAKRGYQLKGIVDASIRDVIEGALAHPFGRSIVEFFATLIAADRLDLRIAFRPDARGIFHDKIGIFTDDDGHSVSFSGSANETFQAWDASGNHESFEVFTSWEEESRVDSHREYFERLWDGLEIGVETVHFPQVSLERLVAVANSNRDVAAAFSQVMIRKRRRQPQTHQTDAVAAWEENQQRGILEHATGAGKTLTAILALRSWLEERRSALVIVPSELLLNQWRAEMAEELDDIAPKYLFVGAGNTSWRDPDVVEGFTRADGGARVTLATMQTASTDEFLVRVVAGDHLLVVADEVHRLGSRQASRIFDLDAGARLGLSATPRRFGDANGTSAILDYFGPVVHEFGLADAIEAGRLCKYRYHIHPVALSGDEAERWRAMTKQIAREIASLDAESRSLHQLPDHVKLLLIRRADISKKAAGKVALAVDVLRVHYAAGQRWLIYCDDREQLDEVADALASAGYRADRYYSAMADDKRATMRYFTQVSGILVAIKCLDEGVDIPNADHALILASSRNPREFIQRRGRVLRTFPGKYFAEVHDALVVPPPGACEPGDTEILRGEIARALQFAASASNEAVTFRLRRLVADFNLDLRQAVNEGGYEADGAEETIDEP